MRLKIKQIIVGLLLGMVLFGMSGGIAKAAEPTGQAKILTDQITALNEEFEKIGKALQELDMCLDKGVESLDYWSAVSIDVEGKKIDCGTVFRNAKNATGKMLIPDMREVYKNKGKEILNLNMQLRTLETINIGDTLKLGGQSHFKNLPDFIGKVIDLLVGFVGVASLCLIVFGGFRIIVAGGNDNEIQKAKGMIEYAVIGLVMVLLAYLIVALLRGVLYH